MSISVHTLTHIYLQWLVSGKTRGKKKLKRVRAKHGSHQGSTKKFAATSVGKKAVAKVAKLSSNSESEEEGDDNGVSLLDVRCTGL